jgi:uncharacterized protein YifE (UPF0438 family)
MKDNNLLQFEEILKNHRAANHPLFEYLNKKSETGLTAQEYQAFAMNYVARTVWTLPEVAAAGAEAAQDFRVKATAYSSATFFEEGGGGKPKKVHSKLMMDAINYHGKAVYGKEFQEIDAKKILDITRAAYEAMQAQAFNTLDDSLKKIISDLGIFNFEATNKNINQVIKEYLPNKEEIQSGEMVNPHYMSVALSMISELKKMGIHDNVISYGFEQLAVMKSQERGKLQGCAYAHEGLADDMMLNVFKIMRSGAEKYKSGRREFDKKVYPYFSAHGDYYAMADGTLEVNAGGGVEAVHARREREKIEELPEEYIKSALKGATEFADRQASVWDGILESMNQASKGQEQKNQGVESWISRIKITPNSFEKVSHL